MDKIQMTHGPGEVASLLSEADFTWCIAGGWAVDMHIGGGRRRNHADVDVVCLADEAQRVRRHLADWDLQRVVGGDLLPWDDHLEPAHQAWARPHPATEWAFEVLFELVVGGTWYFRRNRAVNLPAAKLVTVIDHLPVFHLGASLLYKAKRDDDVDRADLADSLPVMAASDRSWLREAVTTTHGADHLWVDLIP